MGKPRPRPAIALLLAALLVAASLPMALARSAPAVAGIIAICAAGGPATLAVDARGRPAGAAAGHCPDCLPHVTALAASAPPPAGPPLARTRRPRPPGTGTALPRPARRPRVRDPPLPSV